MPTLTDQQLIKNLAAEISNQTINQDVTDLITTLLPDAISSASVYAPTVNWDINTNPDIVNYKLWGAFKSLYILICAMELLRRLGVYNKRVEAWEISIDNRGERLAKAVSVLAKADLDNGQDLSYGSGFSGASETTYPADLTALRTKSIQFIKGYRGKTF